MGTSIYDYIIRIRIERIAELLSEGARDAAYIALRISLMLHIFRDQLPPLMLDDALCQFDDGRAKIMIELISKLSELPLQSIIFTCRQRESNLAKDKADVTAITAAMGIGTGLSEFEKKYPDRYFDVGIAEAHALTFSAGLAANGLKPYVAIYSTFLQRAYDNIIIDVCMQNAPVVFALDRAGIVGADGETHHGIFDVAFLSAPACASIIFLCVIHM